MILVMRLVCGLSPRLTLFLSRKSEVKAPLSRLYPPSGRALTIAGIKALIFESKAQMIIFGPLLTPSAKFQISNGDFTHSGFDLEFTLNGEHHNLAVFQDISHWRKERSEFDDYYVLARKNEWPFEFNCRNFQIRTAMEGDLIRLSPVVRTLMQDLANERSFISFFEEFRQQLPVSAHVETYTPTNDIHLIPELEQAGYFVSGVVHYGRQLAVELSWRFPDESKEWDHIHAGRMTFSLSSGELRSPKWAPHHWPENIENLFWCRLREIAPRDPQLIFNSAADLAALSSHVEWHPTISLPVNELKARRKELVLSRQDLWDAPLALARVMIDEQLYAESTSPHQIAIGLRKEISNLASP